MVLGASPVEIIAVVPEGSSVTARTQSADVFADGTFAAVAAYTESGDVRAPGHADQFTANTQSGDVTVSATEQARNDDLDMRANSMSGDVQIPPRRQRGTGAGPRRRTS
nr:DUF4097 domain-containing protein [Streptomyces sp. CEV 2-1]